MSKTRIEYATGGVWNPVWGCGHGCKYCYARRTAKRFGKKLFGKEYPGFETPYWIEKNFNRKLNGGIVFVNSMSDPAFWTEEQTIKIIGRMFDSRDEKFVVLSKDPLVFSQYNWPKNAWLGTSTAVHSDYKRAISLHEHTNDFTTRVISLEPLLDNETHDYLYMFNWVILGLETGRRGAFNPQPKSIQRVVDICKERKIPLFMKNSVARVWTKGLVREFPR